jgi:hypothetical protein
MTEIEVAKAHCMCGAPMDEHDDWGLGHTPLSVFDFHEMPEGPFTDEIEGLMDPLGDDWDG